MVPVRDLCWPAKYPVIYVRSKRNKFNRAQLVLASWEETDVKDNWRTTVGVLSQKQELAFGSDSTKSILYSFIDIHGVILDLCMYNDLTFH